MDGRDCLARCPFVFVRIACRVCSRRGSYRFSVQEKAPRRERARAGLSKLAQTDVTRVTRMITFAVVLARDRNIMPSRAFTESTG
jgi:hypothetical protein